MRELKKKQKMLLSLMRQTRSDLCDALATQGYWLWDFVHKHDQAWPVFAEALRYSRRRHLVYYYRGWLHLKRSDHERAHRDISRAVMIAPRNAFCWFLRGITALHFRGFKAVQDVLDDFEQALGLDGDFPEIRAYLGILGFACGRCGIADELGYSLASKGCTTQVPISGFTDCWWALAALAARGIDRGRDVCRQTLADYLDCLDDTAVGDFVGDCIIRRLLFGDRYRVLPNALREAHTTPMNDQVPLYNMLRGDTDRRLLAFFEAELLYLQGNGAISRPLYREVLCLAPYFLEQRLAVQRLSKMGDASVSEPTAATQIQAALDAQAERVVELARHALRNQARKATIKSPSTTIYNSHTLSIGYSSHIKNPSDPSLEREPDAANLPCVTKSNLEKLRRRSSLLSSKLKILQRADGFAVEARAQLSAAIADLKRLLGDAYAELARMALEEHDPRRCWRYLCLAADLSGENNWSEGLRRAGLPRVNLGDQISEGEAI